MGIEVTRLQGKKDTVNSLFSLLKVTVYYGRVQTDHPHFLNSFLRKFLVHNISGRFGPSPSMLRLWPRVHVTQYVVTLRTWKMSSVVRGHRYVHTFTFTNFPSWSSADPFRQSVRTYQQMNHWNKRLDNKKTNTYAVQQDTQCGLNE